MKRLLILSAALLALAGAAFAQMPGSGQTGIGGCAPQVGGPNGCGPQIGGGPMMPPPGGGGYVPPSNPCDGTINFNSGCVQPMAR